MKSVFLYYSVSFVLIQPCTLHNSANETTPTRTLLAQKYQCILDFTKTPSYPSQCPKKDRTWPLQKQFYSTCPNHYQTCLFCVCDPQGAVLPLPAVARDWYGAFPDSGPRSQILPQNSKVAS